MKLEDIAMPETVENEVKDTFYNIRLLLNNGRYQISSYSVAPTASDGGQTGEIRLVREGSTGGLYIHDGTDWWYTSLTRVT